MTITNPQQATHEPTWSGAPVFVHETVDLPLRNTAGELPDAAWAELVPPGTMEELATTAFAAGRAELASPAIEPTRPEVRLQLLNLPLGHRAGTMVIPLRWSVAGWRDDAAPALDANLEISSPAPNTGRLTLVGSYRAPSRPQAQVWESADLARAAHVTARTFLSLLAASVEDRQPSGTTQ
jgi:hypothetical protein